MLAKNSLPARIDPTPRRHICLVTETFLPEINGVAQTLARLQEGLQSQGIRVSLIRPRQPKSDGASASDRNGVQLVRSLPLPGYRGLHIGVPAGAALRRRWTADRPDAVYVATQGPLGWSAVSVARRLNIAVFSGFHTNFDAYSKHYHAGWFRAAIWRYLIAFHNRTDGTLVPSAELRDRLRAKSVHNVGVLGRGVDSALFTPARRSAALRRAWRAEPGDLVVAHVGRLAAEKNIGLAIDAFRAIQRVHARAKFILVGDGPLRVALQKKNPDLIFCGTCAGVSLAEHYASADVFLFPSETETFGNVTLEALASGLAAIAYDYAAAHLHIDHGVNGILANYGDAGAFTDAAVNLTRAPAALAELRRQARRRAEALDWQRVVQAFADFLLSEPEHRAEIERDLWSDSAGAASLTSPA